MADEAARPVEREIALDARGSLQQAYVSEILEVLLAEYSVARDEISKRSDAQLGVQNLALSSIIALVTIVIVYEADSLLLVVGSIACSIFSMIWIDHANVIRSLGSHIREVLAPRTVGLLKDERLMSWETRRKVRRPRLFHIKTLGPQMLIFQGLSVGLLIASVSALSLSRDLAEILRLCLWLVGCALFVMTWVSWVQLIRKKSPKEAELVEPNRA